MALSQVVEDKTSPIGKKLVRLSGATDAGSAAAMAVAQEAQTIAEAALPKAGGEMTGSVKFKSPVMDRTEKPAATQYLSEIYGWDKNGKSLTSIYCSRGVSGITNLVFNTYGEDEEGSEISALSYLCLPGDGSASYLVVPTPEIVSPVGAAVNRAYLNANVAQKFSDIYTIHAGGENASDTADLNSGRGMSADMPFATLEAATRWLAFNGMSGHEVNIVLHADMEITQELVVSARNFMYLGILSDTTRRKLSIADRLSFRDGKIALSNLDLEALSGARGFFYVRSETFLSATNCALSGSVSRAVLEADFGSADVSGLTGTVTGKKYIASKGARIFGAAGIPGSEAGTCDANSIAA